MSRSKDSVAARDPLPRRWPAALGALLLVAGPLLAGDPRSSLLMVEGEVSSVNEEPGEGGLSIVSVQLGARPDGSRAWVLLLAPRTALDDIGFEVEVGDHLKARIFPSEEGPARVHKILNLTRRKMVRIRTLSQIPLWDGSGAWQGGQCRVMQAAGRESRGGPPGPRY